MIDPLATPWTELDLDDELGPEPTFDPEPEFPPEPDFDADPDLAGRPVTSYLDAKPPHRRGQRPGSAPRSAATPRSAAWPRSAARSAPRPRTASRATPGPRTHSRRRARELRRRVALPVLALLVAAGLALTAVTIGLVNWGLATATGNSAAASPLAVPAPAVAGGLPRHYEPVTSAVTLRLINAFVQRFTAVTGRYSGQPEGLYREPGTIDLATDDPGWVMYLGYNSATDLGAPGTTIARVMADLTGSTATSSSWSAAPGRRGGAARCALATFGDSMVTLCAWATGRTIGALMSPTSDTRGKELAVLMPLMRLDLQPG